MRRRLCALMIGALSVLAQPAAADFETAVEAYARGDHRAALQNWTREAQGGDAAAQWLVGNMYLNGEGLPGRDPARAAVFYRSAAEQGYAEAQVSLATLYRLGRGVEQDYRQALAWLYEAASQRHALAQVDLGDLFLTGVPGTVEADPTHALEWYRLAAKQGVILAQFKLAQLYLEGVGTPPDAELGLAWMAIARHAAATPMESALSRRVMGLDQVVETDTDRRTLAEIIRATYAITSARLPRDVVVRAETKAKNYDPASF